MKHMKQWMQKLLAMALVLMMACVPVLAYATEAVPVDVEGADATLTDAYQEVPGSMLQERFYAALYEGHEVTFSMQVQDFAMPAAVMTEPEAKEIAEMVRAVLTAMRFDVSVVMHEEQAIANIDVRMQDVSVMHIAARVAADGVSFALSPLPGKTLFIPTALPAMALQQFSGGNLYFSGLDDNPDAQAVFEAIYAYFEDQVAGWVSKWQIERGDLYTYDAEGEPATDTRDAAAIIMNARIRPEDLKTLIRGLADKFYADGALQQHVVNLMAKQGVTREMVRTFADQLPLSIAALTATDKPTEFAWAMDDMSGTVGFNGTMPAFFAQSPFKEAILDYDRKTLDDGQHGHAIGEIDFPEGQRLEGDMKTFLGKPDGGKTAIGNEMTLKLIDQDGKQLYSMVSNTQGTVTRTEDAETMDITTKQAQQIDPAADSAVLAPEEQAMQDAMSATTTHYTGSVRAIGDLDFEAEYTAEISAGGTPMASVRYTASSGAYKPGNEFAGEVIDMHTITPEQSNALDSDLEAGMEQAGMRMMAAMPASVLRTFRKMMNEEFAQPRRETAPGPVIPAPEASAEPTAAPEQPEVPEQPTEPTEAPEQPAEPTEAPALDAAAPGMDSAIVGTWVLDMTEILKSADVDPANAPEVALEFTADGKIVMHSAGQTLEVGEYTVEGNSLIMDAGALGGVQLDQKTTAPFVIDGDTLSLQGAVFTRK